MDIEWQLLLCFEAGVQPESHSSLKVWFLCVSESQEGRKSDSLIE